MKILIALTYYQPYTSGLTIYAVRQAQAFANLGHQVTVLTSQYDRSLPKSEESLGVRIIRVPVVLKISKGALMPQLPFRAWQLIGEADVVNLHVPQFDSSILAIITKLRKKPVVMTYHCDIQMPSGLINQIAGGISGFSHRIAAGLADVIVHNTRDFAEHSDFLKDYLNKMVVIQPPVWLPKVEESDIAAFCEKFGIDAKGPVIGMVSRLATEKGVEYLVEALPRVLQDIPDSRVIFAGAYQNVPGESAYQEKILTLIEKLEERWRFLGVLSDLELTSFLTLCDVLVLPSINSTESFGMVQIEAMSCGTPVVATDLPGVRQPVKSTGMGRIVPPMDAPALAQAIVEVIGMKKDYNPSLIAELETHYAPETIAEDYERLFKGLLEGNG